MGPILRRLIAFGNASVNSLNDIMITPEMEFMKCIVHALGIYYSLKYVTLALHNYSAAMEMRTGLSQICKSCVISRSIHINCANFKIYVS